MSVTAVPAIDPLAFLNSPVTAPSLVGSAPATSFSQLIANGIDSVNGNALAADKIVRAFALDDTIPVHQVTFALSQAQLSLEMILQVRARLVEGYQQLMNMQL